MFSQPKKTKINIKKNNVVEIEKSPQDISSVPIERNEIKKQELNRNLERKEFTVFSYNHYYEQEIVRKKINQLLDLIKNEINLIKQTEKSLISEVKDIEKNTIEEFTQKSGIYHINFLEIILSILKNVRKKVSESKSWLEALISKKKKRGSIFLTRSKKMGTQYSLSQELNVTRSVQ
jgi:hypothetical protein